MKFDIYYNTDKKHLIKSNVSKEDAIRYLKSLTLQQKTQVFLEPVIENTKVLFI